MIAAEGGAPPLHGRGTPPTPNALAVTAVAKTFGATVALRDASLTVRPGSIHALVGANGSGKSTLIKLLAGFHQPDDEVAVTAGDRTFALGDAHAAHEACVRFVHQDLGVVPSLGAVDNLALGGRYETWRHGQIRWAAQRAHAAAAIGALGYEFDVTAPLARLAPVERTAVAIARALDGLRVQSSVLVLDEPTATMPNREVQRLFSTLRRLRAEGMSVIYVSHHLEEVLELADAVTVMRDGRTVQTRAVADLERSQLIEAMLGVVPERRVQTASAPEGPPLLEVTNLCSIRLRDVSFTVGPGEIVGVAGVTGSGREALCPALFGTISRTGEVRVGGRELRAADPGASVGAGMVLVPADRRGQGLFERMSVRENLTLSNLRPYWRSFRLRLGAERSAARQLVSELGVKTPSVEAGTDALSGGNQQKIVVGRLLELGPEVLLLDEPTQGVDIAAKAEIHLLLERAAAAGTAIVVCSTDEAELQRLCYRVLILRKGVVAQVLDASDVTEHKIAAATLGDGATLPAATGTPENRLETP